MMFCVSHDLHSNANTRKPLHMTIARTPNAGFVKRLIIDVVQSLKRKPTF